jgi:radical SAM protein with 4Fe4S-binding SPASM domain
MNNAYALYSNLLFAKAGSCGIPLSGTFELTARCNLDCRMCYIHRRENDAAARAGELTAAQWLALAEDCRDAGTLLLLLTGGEPFLRPDFREIYTGCRRMGMLVSINSNATLIDGGAVDFLTADPPARVNITLYGASPETYGALCGDPSAYDRAVRAILALNAANIPVKLNFSITPYNRQDAERVYAFAREHELPLQAASYMFPPVRACEFGGCRAERSSPQEAAENQMVWDRFRFPPDELHRRWRDQLAGVRVEDPDRECQELPTERIRCRAGSTTFWITWDGQMRPCGLMTEPNADVGALGFSAAWQATRAAREGIMVPPACTSCKYSHACEQCAALCHAETGSFTGVPEYVCEKTRAYLELAARALEESSEN